MTKRPILFSAPMVKAILAGTKTQTRRVIKPLSGEPTREGDIFVSWPSDAFIREGATFRTRFSPGDTLWVREAWRTIGNAPLSECVDHRDIMFRASVSATEAGMFTWKPSIHMPRWASRITLRVTAVKVERLQDISETDAEAEGCEEGYCVVDGIAEGWSAKSDFQRLWTSINGAASWEANPYVAAISFERVK